MCSVGTLVNENVRDSRTHRRLLSPVAKAHLRSPWHYAEVTIRAEVVARAVTRRIIASEARTCARRAL